MHKTGLSLDCSCARLLLRIPTLTVTTTFESPARSRRETSPPSLCEQNHSATLPAPVTEKTRGLAGHTTSQPGSFRYRVLRSRSWTCPSARFHR